MLHRAGIVLVARLTLLCVLHDAGGNVPKPQPKSDTCRVSWVGRDSWSLIQLLALHRTPSNATLCLRALSWSSGSLGALTVPWGAWSVPSHPLGQEQEFLQCRSIIETSLFTVLYNWHIVPVPQKAITPELEVKNDYWKRTFQASAMLEVL